MRFHSLFLQASLLLTVVPLFCRATITVPGTGHRYASRQEHSIGRKLWRGYVYEARLQYIDANPWLCNKDDDNDDVRYNITVPVDTPVALLVRGGSCSLHEKARTVLDRVYPKGIVRYLIVGSGRRASDPADADADTGAQLEEDWTTIPLHPEMNLDGIDDDERALPPATLWNPDEERVDRRRHHSDNDNKSNADDSIPLTFLHVSLRTAEELLLDVIRTQTPETKMMGGPRINLDGRLGNGLFDSEAAIWVALSALLSACACSAILLANSNDYLPDEANQAPPTRPQRRRLTREQVKAMFPRYLYSEDGTLQPLMEVVDPEAQEEGMPHHHHHHHHHHHLPDPRELDCCSICLDEYESGDKLRCLPCHHAFHSKCIGIWLSERSATCPLCKSELHEVDDESSSSEESAQEAAVPAEAEPALAGQEGVAPEQAEPTGWWDRLHVLARSRRNVNITEPLIDEASTQQLGASQNQEPSNGNEQPSADFPRSTWWRRMFPSQRGGRTAELRPVEESPESMLAEPLLHESQDNDASAEAAAASVEEPSEMEMQEAPEPLSFEPRQVTI